MFYFAAYADHGYNTGEELEPVTVDFFFDQGRSYLKRSEVRSERGNFLDAFIAEKNVTKTVTITGTHSPEGSERINSGLSEDRASAIEKFYRQKMKSYDYGDLSESINFILKPVIEDWAEFKKAVAAYDGVSDSEKNAMLSVVNGSGSFEEKEDRLQKLAGYKKVFKDVYPQLRAAKTEILKVKEKKTEAEISVLSKGVVAGNVPQDTLSKEELLYSATLTPSLDEKAGIYQASSKKEDDWVSHNNLGAVYLNQAIAASGSQQTNLVEKAVSQLEIAFNRQQNAFSAANLGVAYVMQGNTYKALDMLSKAESLSPNNELRRMINGAKGALQIKTAEYSDAVSALSNANQDGDVLFDKGLALILAKDYQKAVQAFDELTGKSSDYALAYYGAAIASARLQNGTDVMSYIKKAVQNDPSLREKALNDLEFLAYKDTQDFRDAVAGN